MNDIKSALVLERLVFDKIEFTRKGFQNKNEISFEIRVQIGVGMDQENAYKVTLILSGDKQDEYELEISLSGYFAIENDDSLDEKRKEDLINRNAVAILMPYLRSEVSLLTAQPETESVVLPPFNINKMMDSQSKT